METFHSLGLHCYDDICHCDWRITLYGCIESDAARIINIINISLSGLVSVIGLGILYHRIIIKGHSLMDLSPKKGLIRPKPIDSLFFILTIYNMIRLVSSAVLVVDAAPNNMIFRSFIFEIGWQFGVWGCAAYVIGIAQASADSQKFISNKWLPSPHIIDTAAFTFLAVPFILNNATSIATGVLATSNIKVADILIRLLYVLWFFHCGSLATSIAYCGSRLIQTLISHLKNNNVNSERHAKLKAGIFKIRSLVVLICIAQYSFALFLLLYGILRDFIMKNYVGSIILCAVWNLLGPTATLLGELIIIFNPKMDKESSNTAINGSSTGQSTTVFESQNTTKMDGGMNMTFEDTLTNTALDNLKLKQEESLKSQNYEQPFETAVYKRYHHVHSENPTEMYIDDQESEYEDFELQRQTSRSHLVNKTY